MHRNTDMETNIFAHTKNEKLSIYKIAKGQGKERRGGRENKIQQKNKRFSAACWSAVG